MSKPSEEKQERPRETRDDFSGTAGVERTVGTTSTSTGRVERIGVAPAMPDTGSLAQRQPATSRDKSIDQG